MAEKTPEEIVLERIKDSAQTGSGKLNLSRLDLDSLPIEVCKLTNLHSLDLRGNYLKNLPAEITELKNLKHLILGGNQFQTIPSYLLALTELEFLSMGGNKLSVISNEISSLSNLKVLDLIGNSLADLPVKIATLTKLKYLDIGSNKLRHIPPEIEQLQNLENLNLGNNYYGGAFNKFIELPPSITKLTNIKALNLTHIGLSKLPAEIGNLINLQSLDLSNNELIDIPAEIAYLSDLRSLHLGGNRFTDFPISITQLKKLEKLKLGYQLDVKHNEIKNLPSGIRKLRNLKEISLFGINLVEIPKEIGELTNLVKIEASFNNIRDLPHEIMQLVNLQEISLVANPLKIPPEISEQKPQFIFSYYFKHSKKPINEAKVLIIGQGAVGKSSLVRRFILDDFDTNEIKTEGISIYRWQVDNQLETENQHSKINLNIWDFGGQEIMHATHQFFLTKRSLYMLVLDSRLTQEENRVEYWLKIIQSFGGESPVLIVGNKIDQHPLDIDRTGLQKKYPNIVGVLETSAATGAGIEELKAAITEQVNNLPHVRDLLPETWFTVKTKLEELGRQSNFITHDKYLELCAENEVSDETSQRTLIGFLHDLGVVLHFQDDPRLEALGILNPQWVTNGVYKILNSHTLFQNKGVLTVSMLDEILNLPEYPRGKRLFIVDMMKKFELCYDIEPDKTFLVPDLLPKDEPATDGRENALAFQYHYAVLPSSVITRFIVRMNEFVQEKVWRTGVVLKDGGSTALVKADTEDRKVFIWVSGDEHKRHDFLSKIRGQFDAIHKTITRLDAKEMVPVPGHPEAEPVDYDLLLQMDHNNVDVYPVLSNGKMIVVNVKAMLNGVARELDRQRNNVTNFYIGGDVKDSTIIAGDDNEVKEVIVIMSMFNLKIDEEIQLRNIHPDDAEALFDLMERNRARLRPWIHPSSLPETAKATRLFTINCLFSYYGNPFGSSELAQYFQELESYFSPSNRPLDLGIWVRDELAGTIFMAGVSGSPTALEFGYWITEEYEGKGIITRCISALMDYAIDEMGIQRFVIGCAANNQRSRAVPERLGYRLHVTQPNGEVVGEYVYDRTIYGIRSTGWRERNK